MKSNFIAGVHSMPVTFTPGRRSAAERLAPPAAGYPGTMSTPHPDVRVAVVAHRQPASSDQQRRALRDAGIATEWWVAVAKGKHAAAAVTEAVDHGANVVIVCGGDGTVRAEPAPWSIARRRWP